MSTFWLSLNLSGLALNAGHLASRDAGDLWGLLDLALVMLCAWLAATEIEKGIKEG